MSKQYRVNDYLVDQLRNQISYQNQSTPLPKKALAVLTILAENAGSVVSHDELMEKVWTNSIVAPNTLQRSIAQIRKAFGDDSKQQSYIKTHAKQGYSLEAEVIWLNSTTSSAEQLTVSSTVKPPYSLKSIVLICCSLTVLALLAWLSLTKESKPKLEFNYVRPLTASDDREANARYSSDGRYVVFYRYHDYYQQHLWAKDLTTLKEYQLTTESGFYGSHNWSEDGNQLTFTSLKNDSTLPAFNNKSCWQLLTLDFAAAIKKPQPTTVRVNCTAKRMAVARWLPNGNIGLLKQTSDNTDRQGNILQGYNIREDQFSTIYSPSENEIYSYDFSFKTNTFAIIARTKDNEHIVERLTTSGEVLSSALIVLANNNSAHEYYNIYFHPSGEYLLTSTEMGVFQLFFDGSMQKIQTLGHRNLFEPDFHPSEKKFIAIQESGDQDIAIIDLNPKSNIENEAVNVEYNKATSFARSNTLDVNAKYQPNGHLIAFNSTRSGSRQLWLFDGNTSRQLSRLDSGIQSMNFVWSPSGDEIATVSGDKLLIFMLDGKVKTLNTSMPISKVMQWSEPNQLVVIANQDNINRVFQLRINAKENINHTFTNLMSPQVKWARVTQNSKLIYIDESKDIWLKSVNEPTQQGEKITALTSQVAGNRLTLKHGFLYGINRKRELWRYQLSTQQFEIIKRLSPSARYISDINKNKALITQTITHNIDIIEFY